MEEMVGAATIPYTYNIISEINDNYSSRVQQINSNYLNNYVLNNDVIPNLHNFNGINYTEVTKKAIWKLRKYDHGAIRLCVKLDDLELYLKKETVTKSDVIRLLRFIVVNIFSKNTTVNNINEVDQCDFTTSLGVEHQQLLVIFERNRLDHYIDDQQKHIYINLLIEIANIVKTLHNLVVDYEYFVATGNLLKMCFHHCKLIIYNYHKLNNY
jgi:hypothetical protein